MIERLTFICRGGHGSTLLRLCASTRAPLLALVLAIGAACPVNVFAEGGERMQLAVAVVQDAPVINGRLDESVWKNAKFESGFVHIHEGLPATPDTSFAILASPTHLYIGVICHEPHPEKIVKSGRYLDSIELFLDPERTGYRYIYLKLDVLNRLRIILEDYGKIGSYYGRGRQRSGFGKPESAVRIGKDAWIAELAIAFAGCGVAPETGDRWHFNICRNNLTLPERLKSEFYRNYRRLSSWGRLQPGEQFVGVDDFNLFGILSGVPSPVYSEEEAIEVRKLRERVGLDVEVNKAPFKLHSGVVYKRVGGVEVDLNVYELGSDSPTPAIMWLHGGAMMSGVNEMEAFQRDLFLNWGYSIVSANYRLPPEGKWPAYKEDIVDAFDWIHENGTRFNIDTDRLGVAGLSAGGYLSYLLGVHA